MYINNNVSFGMVLFCKCVREFGKVWAFARAEFGMGGTGICPSPLIMTTFIMDPVYATKRKNNNRHVLQLFL